MPGLDVDTPLHPFGGPEEISFTPDSKAMIFTASNAGRKSAWSTNYDLFMVNVGNPKHPISITSKNKAWDSSPIFSPDGRYLVYLAMERAGFEADKFRIILRQWPEGTERVIAENWDRSPSSLTWSRDSRFIYATAADLGQRSLFEISLQSGRARRILSQGTIGSINAGAKRIFYGYDTLKSPVEIFSVKIRNRKIKQLTKINAGNIKNVTMGDYEQFKFSGWNNENVYCYLVKPSGFKEGKKYPVAFLIHGGPQGSFGNHFHYRWNPQAYAGAGFAVVMVDFHGSVGYGQKFTDSITGDWGGKPLIDLKKGLKAALNRYSWMDANNVVALGASYGGYMINWIAGNWPERFKCLVNHDGNLDERMAYFDTEELWFPEWEHGGTPWNNPEGYEKHNPVNFIKNWKTPMLIIHGALDFRVVETQGFSTFTVLQRLGIPSKLLYFPDENHWVQKPHNSIQWHSTVINWIKRWIKK
jgi:dipeptidyl aminopeptidase/acylaminoacyl peptidase